MKSGSDFVGPYLAYEHAGAVLEEYVVGQGTEPDSTKWITNIIYTVKPKS